MNNKARVAFVTISALLLAACTAKAPVGTENQANLPTATPMAQNTSFSVRDLLGLGKDQTCTYSTTSVENGVSTAISGTLYISGSKLAENVQMTSSDKKIGTQNMNLISDGTYMYSYDTTKKLPGMKFKIDQTAPTGTAANTQNGVDMDKKVDMKCSPWTVDSTKFAIPKDVQFTDLSSLMQKAKTNIPTVPANIPTIPEE